MPDRARRRSGSPLSGKTPRYSNAGEKRPGTWRPSYRNRLSHYGTCNRDRRSRGPLHTYIIGIAGFARIASDVKTHGFHGRDCERDSALFFIVNLLFVDPPRCTERYHLEQERAFNEQLERERTHAEESAELDEVRRKRDMMRQRNSRLCRKYGLKGRRERKG